MGVAKGDKGMKKVAEIDLGAGHHEEVEKYIFQDEEGYTRFIKYRGWQTFETVDDAKLGINPKLFN